MAEKNITYLFGAGASKHALPVVNELPSRLEEVKKMLALEANYLSETEFFSDIDKSRSKREYQLELINEFDWLIEAAFTHATIDTYAKKLFLTIESNYHNSVDSLNKLKRILSIYFILEQERRKTDQRYDTFFASILKETYDDLPKHIKIISWNYDYQFEKTYAQYSGDNTINGNQKYLNVKAKHMVSNSSDDRFSIYKLNGTTTIHSNDFRDYEFISKINGDFTTKTIEEIIYTYSALKNSKNNFCGVSFAWERKFKRGDIDIVNVAKKETSNTNILIIIGYSFPYFNRDIDKEIILSMKSLEKIYIQSPEALNIKDRILTIIPTFDKDNIVIHSDVGQFLIPNELS